MIIKERKKGFLFFAISLLFFVVLLLEFIPIIAFGHSDISLDSPPIDWILHWISTCLLWGVSTFFICKLANKKLAFNLFSFKEQPTKMGLALSFCIVILLTAMLFVSWDNKIKIVAEFNNYLTHYGNIGIIVFIFQCLYYAFETAIIVAMIGFAQKGFDLVIQKPNIPLGGIFLALTWGLGHILTKNFTAGIFLILPAILFGVIYILCKRNLKYAYILIFLAFVL